MNFPGLVSARLLRAMGRGHACPNSPSTMEEISSEFGRTCQEP
jgi:hypothetical protein